MEQSIKVGSGLGEKIRKARNAKDWTQDELAAKLQVNGCDMERYTVSRIENGKRHITVAELHILKELLGMCYEDFLMQDEK